MLKALFFWSIIGVCCCTSTTQLSSSSTASSASSFVTSSTPSIARLAIVDAGSRGSRIHIFQIHGDMLQFPLKATWQMEKTEPGLSSFINPNEAAASLKPLIAFAVDRIPMALHRATMFMILATEGMRAIPHKRASAILDACRQLVKETTNFVFNDDYVRIIHGSDESAYEWFTFALLSGQLLKKPIHVPQALLQLGGGSIQLSYQLIQPSSLYHPKSLFTHKYGGDEIQLFSQSFAQLGLQHAKERYESWWSSVNAKMHDPCLIKISSEERTSFRGNFTLCQQNIHMALFAANMSQQCPLGKVCGPGNVIIPDLSQVDVFAMGDFFFIPNTIGLLKNEDDKLRIVDIIDQGSLFCNQTLEQIIQAFHHDEHTTKRAKFGCFGSAYISLLLSSQFHIAPTKPFRAASKIQTIPIDWAIGAAAILSQQSNKVNQNQPQEYARASSISEPDDFTGITNNFKVLLATFFLLSCFVLYLITFVYPHFRQNNISRVLAVLTRKR